MHQDGTTMLFPNNGTTYQTIKKQTRRPLVRKRTTPTERRPLVGEL
jgi:hypothetical protein